jgi:hypothetical protein
VHGLVDGIRCVRFSEQGPFILVNRPGEVHVAERGGRSAPLPWARRGE